MTKKEFKERSFENRAKLADNMLALIPFNTLTPLRVRKMIMDSWDAGVEFTLAELLADETKQNDDVYVDYEMKTNETTLRD